MKGKLLHIGQRRDAFSMMELVFVIIILGILAAIAIPRLSLTRSDAQLIAVENDIVSAINAIQREVFSQNIEPSNIDGIRMLELAGLSPSRWVAQGNGVRLAKNGVLDVQNDCITLMQENGKLVFFVQPKADSTLCTKLLERHQARREVPLSTSNAIF
ncbi:prepilin-type N-terminal cleavage/methylation domain-containing protein [Helicobacter mastomyrinus]|uniref:Prepilin-type N-terminal cleavage/methylation domain-containing protein n=1 Tax=Helicobacter mastomyrinus TaxID=287948 RepID=A0ABZ3F959_9HELI|nr:prepilin-type N-terminal cleavage/methylation domain-containing protein [uncultured Helicobacter sp.]